MMLPELLTKISPLPWHLCSCGKCTQIHSIPADVEVLDVMSHVEGCKSEGFPYSDKWHEDAQYIELACNEYPKALERIAKLEWELNQSMVRNVIVNADGIKEGWSLSGDDDKCILRPKPQEEE